jgi:hypothetical protein
MNGGAFSSSSSILGAAQGPPLSSDDLLLRHPFNMYIAGVSFGGKTQFVRRLVHHLNQIVGSHIHKVIYCYGIFDPRMFEMQKEAPTGVSIEFHQGIPNIGQLQQQQPPTPLFLILDDLTKEAASSGFLDTFFTKGSHHLNISIAVLTQDLFYKDTKTSRYNAHYIVLMKNPSGARQVRDLATQLFPGQKKRAFFLEAYANATAKNFGYLMIDTHPASREVLRLRTNIFPDEHPPIVFFPRS